MRSSFVVIVMEPMPRFAANLNWLFTEHPFLERFAAARAAGFRGVEFPSPYEHPKEAIAARLSEHGLECVLFNLPSGDKSKGDFGLGCRPERVGEFRAGVALAIEYARALGTRQLNVIAGKAMPGEDRDLLRATLVDNLRYAARAAHEAGLALLVEPINSVDQPGYFLPRQRDGARAIEAARDPNLFLQCDLYHVAMMGDDPARVLDELRPMIRHIQFADAPGRGEPGTGALPLASLFERIDASGYAGWVSAEYRPSGRTEESLGWLAGRVIQTAESRPAHLHGGAK
jgi:hydroxypyruvate isomerase